MATERARFVLEAERSFLPFAELCRRHGISRPTGHKWLKRYQAEGLSAMEDRSHRPHSCPHLTPQPVVDRILEIRRHRGWGAPKIQRVLRDELAPAPSIDAIHRVLVQHELVVHRKPRRRRTHPGPPLTFMDAPNATWTVDFKGEFRTGDGTLCYPLTVQDGHSRFLLECHGLQRLETQQTRRRFEHLFGEYGLPERIRSDNGHPFASNAIARLSQLSVWWIKLGIAPELIEPGKPQQNGRHERMHRTLKEETALPPEPNLPDQQRAFDLFRTMFNYERPHQALDQERPASRYVPSTRVLPKHPEPLTYPAHFEVRRVSQDSTIRWKSDKVFVSHLLGREEVGLEEIGDGVWSVYFGPVHLGWLDELDYRIMDVQGRKRRKR
jgi:transposase InsO family protein